LDQQSDLIGRSKPAVLAKKVHLRDGHHITPIRGRVLQTSEPLTGAETTRWLIDQQVSSY